MTHKDSGWRPNLAMDTYKGFEIWDHDVGPHEINAGEVDGDVDVDSDTDE
jgi:hypothetical protein